MKLIILLVVFASCSSLSTMKISDNYAVSTWEVLENALLKKWDKRMLEMKLGNPQKKYPHPRKKNHIAWIYFDKNTGFQEWGISINSNGTTDSVTYIPKEPYVHQFTLDKILARWKNLSCTHKTKQELSPGLVKTITYLDCDNGHRIINYNMYKEVESIQVHY